MDNQKIKDATKIVWGTNPAGWSYGNGYVKGTKEFFESVLHRRFTEECEWMDEIVHFNRFKDKKVLEIGSGAGYDAYQFCRNGAIYTGIDLTPDNPIIAKKHLDYFGYKATFLEMDVEALSLSDAYDFVFSFGVLHHTPNIMAALKNIHTVLKDGGEAQIIVYHKNSIFYILKLILYDWILKLQFLKKSLKDRRSEMEVTHSKAKALVNVYSAKELHKLCKQAGFRVIKTDVRKLVRDDLPGLPLIKKLYRFIPDAWLYALSKKFGAYLSVRMVKA